MKIFLPFQSTGIGFLGVGTFAKKFKAGMEAKGHEVFFEYQPDYDVLMMIVQAPFAYLREAKRRHIPIVQRLDGVFYWTTSQWMFPLLNLKALLIRHFFADFTIYQSQFSKYSANTFLGKKQPDPSALIYNGVDLDVFTPTGESINLRDNPDQKIFFTVSGFRRRDQIVPMLEALKIYKRKYGDNFKVLIVGPFKKNVASIPDQYRDFKNVRFLGKIENTDLPKYERSADVFLFTHLNPPCPNNIIESLSCGLPVCGVADGAMSELIEHGKTGRLIEARGNGFWAARNLNLEAFADNLHTIVENRPAYSKACRRYAEEHLTLDMMTDQYLLAMEKALKNQQ